MLLTYFRYSAGHQQLDESPQNQSKSFSLLQWLCTGLLLGKVYVTFNFCCLFLQANKRMHILRIRWDSRTEYYLHIQNHCQKVEESLLDLVGLGHHPGNSTRTILFCCLLKSGISSILQKCTSVHCTETLLALALSFKKVVINVHVPGATSICFDNVHKFFHLSFENCCTSKYLFTTVFPECENVANAHANRYVWIFE